MFLLKLKKKGTNLKEYNNNIYLNWEYTYSDLRLQPVNYTHLNKSHNHYNNKKTVVYSATTILFSDCELKKKSKNYVNLKKYIYFGIICMYILYIAKKLRLKLR